ncbi:Hypothetical protein LUCI_0243 [Lucifera butyrica]|uniref:HTH cro/C1-type domain-containing protein n=1 Tax=Lucifera butyrica TaxID=1351585 RepID=A0A498R2J4_9FIRM|nr:helix-turn-helix domain-containing protein [Lucifera butyrica]VBB05037.1 Hypothetical protein LUCI_0243 [Lucifera butyrica]
MILDYKKTGKRLRHARGNLTQAVFAKSLGVSASYVKKTELGGKPSLEYLANIAVSYQVSLDWLLLDDGFQPAAAFSLAEAAADYRTAIADSELKDMITVLSALMSSPDPDLRAWAKIQFRHAFQAYTETGKDR